MNEKDWVIILRDAEEIVGFLNAANHSLDKLHDSEQIFLFSGDTIVDPAHWRDSKLAGSFGHFMLRLMAETRAYSPLLVPDFKRIPHLPFSSRVF